MENQERKNGRRKNRFFPKIEYVQYNISFLNDSEIFKEFPQVCPPLTARIFLNWRENSVVLVHLFHDSSIMLSNIARHHTGMTTICGPFLTPGPASDLKMM